MAYGYGMTYMIGSQVLFFIITIALIIWLVKNPKQQDNHSAKDIIDKRLAAGEIDLKEYKQLLKTIES
ncbi:MAG: hypothetical protein GQ477_01260 [Nanohaloarchaea archaeon]|nr:hypothetical protein [Candidatus Nanohaloarchaea archaeon]